MGSSRNLRQFPYHYEAQPSLLLNTFYECLAFKLKRRFPEFQPDKEIRYANICTRGINIVRADKNEIKKIHNFFVKYEKNKIILQTATQTKVVGIEIDTLKLIFQHIGNNFLSAFYDQATVSILPFVDCFISKTNNMLLPTRSPDLMTPFLLLWYNLNSRFCEENTCRTFIGLNKPKDFNNISAIEDPRKHPTPSEYNMV